MALRNWNERDLHAAASAIKSGDYHRSTQPGTYPFTGVTFGTVGSWKDELTLEFSNDVTLTAGDIRLDSNRAFFWRVPEAFTAGELFSPACQYNAMYLEGNVQVSQNSGIRPSATYYAVLIDCIRGEYHVFTPAQFPYRPTLRGRAKAARRLSRKTDRNRQQITAAKFGIPAESP